MKKSIFITLSDEELIALERIMLDDDREGALKFLQEHFRNKARDILENRGHCKPSFEVFNKSAIPEEFRHISENNH